VFVAVLTTVQAVAELLSREPEAHLRVIQFYRTMIAEAGRSHKVRAAAWLDVMLAFFRPVISCVCVGVAGLVPARPRAALRHE